MQFQNIAVLFGYCVSLHVLRIVQIQHYGFVQNVSLNIFDSLDLSNLKSILFKYVCLKEELWKGMVAAPLRS